MDDVEKKVQRVGEGTSGGARKRSGYDNTERQNYGASCRQGGMFGFEAGKFDSFFIRPLTTGNSQQRGLITIGYISSRFDRGGAESRGKRFLWGKEKILEKTMQ